MARATGRRSGRGAASPSGLRQQYQRQEGHQDEGEEEYEVADVLGRRRRGGALEYLVQWKGYDEQTWEPTRHLHCPELIRAFERQQTSQNEANSGVALSATSVEAHQLDKRRAERFILVADQWGEESSPVLLLQYKPSEDAAPLLFHRVAVDAQNKSVALSVCDVEAVGGWSMPKSARLATARAVIDEELAIRVCLLVFLDHGDGSDSVSSQTTSDGVKRRRRSSSDSQRLATPSQPSVAPTLYFFRLSSSSSNPHQVQLSLLNCVDLPPSLIGSSCGPGDVQVLLADGPHAVVFSRSTQQLAILRLVQDGAAAEFHYWREAVSLLNPDGDTVKRLEFCELVDEIAATHSHLLMSVAYNRSRSRTRRGWLVYPTDDQLPASMLSETFDAVYIPKLQPDPDLPGEQVVCCCVAARDDVRDEVSPVYGWMQPPKSGIASERVDLTPRSFLVVGTTRNSVLVYASGLLLASLVLPATPEVIRVIGHDCDAHRYVVMVCCSNLNRSCFLLAFNTIVHCESIEILQGEALVGEFSLMQQVASVLPTQVLLLNHLPLPQDVTVEGDVDDAQQLVKRCVLLHQPSATLKTVCVRLRLRDSHKSDGKGDKSRGVKRSRSCKADGSTTLRVFKYIERTHKSSASYSTGLSGEFPAVEGEGGASRPSESHAHLDTLVKSLKARLASGVDELERLNGVTRDKRALCRRLDQLVMREWWETNSSKEADRGTLVSLTLGRASSRQDPILGQLESVSKAPASGDVNADRDSMEVRRDADSTVSCAVKLSGFRLVEYIPSTSSLRMDVSLVNHSSRLLLGAFVTVTLKSPLDSDPTASYSDQLTARSSVVSAFHPASKRPMHDGLTTFHVVLKLERPPLRLLRGEQPALSMTVWLHWHSSCDPRAKSTLLIDRYQSASRSPSSFAVASLSIPAADLIAASYCPRRVSTATTTSQELLFLSTGSSLPAWFNQLQSASSSSTVDTPRFLTPSLVRPTFALANWSAGDSQAAVFALGQALSHLPRDVFALRNPLQCRHLLDLLRCLHGLRREILSVQRRAIAPPLDGQEDGGGGQEDDEKKPEDRLSAFVRAHYRLQRETDLRVVGLLRSLQLRADFQETWVSRKL